MSNFSIQTNITSLQAQNNLAASAAFQSKTINEVTSGLRIVNSGDDAAGLAIANSLASDQAVLTQGIQNANNGLATLQTIDGGINNVTTLLDRASTLAAQSASGTFTGSRSTLNAEFQSVVSEISQEAQSIGLDANGQFAQALSVFVGGGQAGNGVSAVQNGSVGIDLSKSAVDAASLGLTGTVATGAAGSDISNGGATTVANILANTANNAGAGISFNFTGAGFSDSNEQTLNVNLTGVANTATLVSAINAAIAAATTNSAGSTTGTAFANAGITASITTDSTGKQQLTFSSSTAAFQVQAGDQTANALLGNFNTTAANASTGQALTSTATGGSALATLTGAATTAGATMAGDTLTFSGAGLASPVVFTFAAASTAAAIIANINDVTSANTTNQAAAIALATAGITASGGTALAPLVFTGSGDLSVVLGGAAVGADATATGLTVGTSPAAVYAGSANAVTLRVQGSGIASPIDFSLAAGATVAQDLTALQSTISVSGKALVAAGIAVTLNATTQQFSFTSATGGSVNVTTSGDSTNALGFGSFVSTGTGAFNSVNGTGVGDGITASSAVGIGTTANNGQTLQISVAGGNAINISTGAVVSAGAANPAGVQAQGLAAATALNAAIQANATLSAAGLVATSTLGFLQITSNNGTAFRLNATTSDGIGDGAGTGSNVGFGTGNIASSTSTSNTLVTDARVDSAGASSTNTFAFNPTADQTVTFTANDASGAAHTTSISLINNTTAGATNNAETIDQAIASINAQLQGSGDGTLDQIVAVKDVIIGGTQANPVDTEGIKFISSLSTFNVALGESGSAASAQGIGTATQQSATQVSSTGSQADISTQAGAEAAVALLKTAVTKLGAAQAAVGKGENDLNFAVALATSQDTNEAAAESNIRDADLATEAANLSKAQILVQAGTAALAQANSAPQAILSLLK